MIYDFNCFPIDELRDFTESQIKKRVYKIVSVIDNNNTDRMDCKAVEEIADEVSNIAVCLRRAYYNNEVKNENYEQA
jgi:hypothetical protein